MTPVNDAIPAPADATDSTEPLQRRETDCWLVAFVNRCCAWQLTAPHPPGVILRVISLDAAVNGNNPPPPWGWGNGR